MPSLTDLSQGASDVLPRFHLSDISMPNVNTFNVLHARLGDISMKNFSMPNVNTFNVLYAKGLDRFNRPVSNPDSNNNVDTFSFATSQAVSGSFEVKENSATVSFVGSVVGDDISVGSDFTYAGDGADDDDMSMVCRSGFKVQQGSDDVEKEKTEVSDDNNDKDVKNNDDSNEEDEGFTVANRREVGDHPPIARAEPDMSEVSTYDSPCSDIDDDDDKDEHVSHKLISMDVSQDLPASVEVNKENNQKQQDWLDVPNIG